MLISHDRKLIFVHIQKTAGDSITRVLRRQIPDLAEVGMKHAFAREGRAAIGEETWNRCFTFAFVRNPWDRLVSWYTMIDNHAIRVGLASGRGPVARLARTARRRWYCSGDRNRLWQYVLRNSNSFDTFIRNCDGVFINKLGQEKKVMSNQLDYLTDEHGKLLVDFVGRFENLQADFDRVAAANGLQRFILPHANRNACRGPHSEYYTPETRDIVARRFQPDIKRFGYRFEERLGRT